MVWNKSLPQGNLPVAAAGITIRDNWDWLEEALKAEHLFPGLVGDRGTHVLPDGARPTADLFDGRINFTSDDTSFRGSRQNYIDRFTGGAWKSYLEGEIGDIRPTGEFSIGATGTHWMLCDGSLVEIINFPLLHSAIGTRFGGSGGSFALPDFRRRMPVGFQSSDSDYDTIGKQGGESLHLLLEDEGPLHDHGSPITTSTDGAHQHGYQEVIVGSGIQGAGSPWGVLAGETTSADGAHGHDVTVTPVGGDVAHENKPPFMVVKFEILGD